MYWLGLGNETRPHQCETCGRRFTLLENLHRHQMIHTDERPFGCHYCHKRFRLAQHLKEHIRIHTGNLIEILNVNSQAVGMDSSVQSALKSILKGYPIFESAAWFFVIILKFIFTSIFEIKIPWHQKISFSKADFYKATDSSSK